MNGGDGGANGPPKPAAAAAAADGSVREGQAHIRNAQGSQEPQVFYNPAQVVNRDLSLAVLRVFLRRAMTEESDPSGRSVKRRQRLDGPPSGAPFYFNIGAIQGPRILEGLAATGLRALRYALELPLSASSAVSTTREAQPGVVVANDLDPAAAEAIRRNARDNAVPSQVDEILAKHAKGASVGESSFGGLIAVRGRAAVLSFFSLFFVFRSCGGGFWGRRRRRRKKGGKCVNGRSDGERCANTDAHSSQGL